MACTFEKDRLCARYKKKNYVLAAGDSQHGRSRK